MAQPEIVDAIREELLALYRRTAAEIDDRLADLADIPDSKAARLRSRLRSLSRSVRADMRDLEAPTRAWITTRMPIVVEAGARVASSDLGLRFAWSQAHAAAVQKLAEDTFADLLSATQYVTRDAVALTRRAAREATRRSIVGGDTAQQAGRSLAREFTGGNPIASVRYSNGARHTLADYSDTVLRTKTAQAFNQGSLVVGREAGVEWVEVFDGPDCGWTDHDDPDLANGTIRTLDDADAHDIAHPRCARGFGMRPDITSAEQAASQGRYTPEQQAALALAERTRAAMQRPTLSTAAASRRQAVVDRRAARVARR